MIQLAWLWVRHQGESALTRWFKTHSHKGRKSAIVALASLPPTENERWRAIPRPVSEAGETVCRPAAGSPLMLASA